MQHSLAASISRCRRTSASFSRQSMPGVLNVAWSIKQPKL